MRFEVHDSIPAVSYDQEIWRYYSTSQFLSVLQGRSLHFSRLDQLEDPFEGYGPIKNLKKEVDYNESRNDQLSEEAQAELMELGLGDAGERVKTSYEDIRKMAMVNCWTKGREDSLPMWKSHLQGGDGLAVRTSFQSLIQAIDSESEISYHGGEVKYFEYFNDFLNTDNFFTFFMSKPVQYQFEHELRLFIWWPTSGQVDETTEEPQPGDTIPMDTLTAPTGRKVGVDLNTLIEGVTISPFGPAWSTVEYWNDILDKFGIDATAERSQLAMEPADILEG